jgi:hypothetical protein
MAYLLLFFCSTAVVLGQPQGYVQNPGTTSTRPETSALWQPALGSKFQIILDQRHRSRSFNQRKQTNYLPADADVFDVDLFDTPASVIKQLHTQGKKVICYFSAGGTETWRPDHSSFNQADKGDTLREWVGEQWLDIRSPRVLGVMKKRIQMASNKGCDAIDPDNIGNTICHHLKQVADFTDAFTDEIKPGGGFATPLTKKDSIAYVKNLAAEARLLKISFGLKNAPMIIKDVKDDIQFAVNEQCATDGMGCHVYEPLVKLGKPVFHIEYVTPTLNGTEVTLRSEVSGLEDKSSNEIRSALCLQTSLGRSRRVMSKETAAKISTVIKSLDLSRFVVYCDGTFVADH